MPTTRGSRRQSGSPLAVRGWHRLLALQEVDRLHAGLGVLLLVLLGDHDLVLLKGVVTAQVLKAVVLPVLDRELRAQGLLEGLHEAPLEKQQEVVDMGEDHTFHSARGFPYQHENARVNVVLHDLHIFFPVVQDHTTELGGQLEPPEFWAGGEAEHTLEDLDQGTGRHRRYAALGLFELSRGSLAPAPL